MAHQGEQQRDDQQSLSRRTLIKGAAGLGIAAGVGGRLAPSSLVRAAETANLQFWDMVWGPPEYIDTGKKLVEQFNEQNPGIKVEYRSTPWNNWYQTFTTAIGAGTAPDVSTGAAYQSVQFYDQGAVASVDDLVAKLKSAGTLTDFLPGTVDRLRYDEHYVALPWAIDIRIPYYRKDLFAAAGVEPPKTWEEFAAAAKALTKGDQYGFVSTGDTLGTHHMYFFMLNNGGGLFTADRQVDLMNERNVEALQFFSDLVKAKSVHPASAGYVSDDAVKVFSQGKAAMFITNPGFETRAPEIAEKIGILEPLTAPHGDKGTISWVNNIMLYTQSKHAEEAKTFLSWWSENLTPLWTEGHLTQLPVRQSIADDPYFANNPTLSAILKNWVPVGKTTGTHADGIFPILNEVEGEGVMQTLVQDLLQGKDVMESMKKAETRMKTIVK
jgi:multiple sugar transport system substrate-binding protein